MPMRVYPSVLPQKVTLPAATYFTIAGTDEMHLQGHAGLVRKVIQIDCWAGTRLAADELMEEVQSFMLAATAFSVNGISESGAEGYEADTQRYRASKEFIIWAQT